MLTNSLIFFKLKFFSLIIFAFIAAAFLQQQQNKNKRTNFDQNRVLIRKIQKQQQKHIYFYSKNYINKNGECKKFIATKNLIDMLFYLVHLCINNNTMHGLKFKQELFIPVSKKQSLESK